MPDNQYDIVTVGGGLAGSCLAKVMAERGARVLVLERERQFKDRVRGEATLLGESMKRNSWESTNYFAKPALTSSLGSISF